MFAAGAPYEFDAVALAAYTDPRWFSALPPPGDGAPLLELRRWPGDTVLAIYALAGPVAAWAAAAPPFAGARLTAEPGATERWAEWRGTLTDDTGEHPIVWSVQAIGESGSVLGALLLPGDAGLGEEAVADLEQELRTALRRVVVQESAWRRTPGHPVGAALLVPQLAAAPVARSEAEDPWQVALATSFTLGLPPGVRARRTDAGVPPPVEIAGAQLWLRGRYTDAAGSRVAIGDGARAGYVAEVPLDDTAWVAGSAPPRGAPSAKRVAGEPFPLLKERTGSKGGSAERWREEGFEGEWLVFRIPFEMRGIEIGLPVLAGRTSPSLYWIAASFRDAGQAPAPPPVDPAERFGIRFERLGRADRARRPWMEGFLSVPGLRAELPAGWWPSASLRSKNGYPIRLVAPDTGVTLAQLQHLDAQATAAASAADSGWSESPRARMHRAERALRRADGALLFVAPEGHGFLFEIASPELVADDAWRRLGDSVQLLRPAR